MSTANPIQTSVTWIFAFLTPPWHRSILRGLNAGIGTGIEKTRVFIRTTANHLYRTFDRGMRKKPMKFVWMRKIKFANIYLFTLATIFFLLGGLIESEIISRMNRINSKPMDYPEYLHLIFFLVGFLALCSVYFSEKMEATILSSANRELQKEMDERGRMESALMESEKNTGSFMPNQNDRKKCIVLFCIRLPMPF